MGHRVLAVPNAGLKWENKQWKLVLVPIHCECVCTCVWWKDKLEIKWKINMVSNIIHFNTFAWIVLRQDNQTIEQQDLQTCCTISGTVPSSSWRWWSTMVALGDLQERRQRRVFKGQSDQVFCSSLQTWIARIIQRDWRLSGPRHRVILGIDGKSTVKRAWNGIIFDKIIFQHAILCYGK